MQRWEYRSHWIKKTEAHPEAKPEKPYWGTYLDDLGENGWEAVGLAVVDEHIIILLKRPKP